MPSEPNHAPLVAVDVGNSRIKLGLFAEPELVGPAAGSLASPTSTPGATALPVPSAMLELSSQLDALEQIATWLDESTIRRATWTIGSVHRRATSRLVDWLRARQAEQITLLAADDLPLVVRVPQRDRVGIDRLLGAVAANLLRPVGTPAVVVDLGTAITVDLVDKSGAFCGGAIMPGVGLAARALHEFTDLLPLVDMQTLDHPPEPIGDHTTAAMQAGLFWGAVGGVRQLVELMSARLGDSPRLYLTGGLAPSVADQFGEQATSVPHLVLAGIALTAWK